MRIPGSSVERSLTPVELEKGPELVELKRKGPPDTYSMKYRVSSCSMRLWKEYCRNNFKFEKTPTHKQKKPNPTTKNPTKTTNTFRIQRVRKHILHRIPTMNTQISR